MANNNPTELFSGPFIPAGGLVKIIGTGVALAIVCGVAAWIAENNAAMLPDSRIGETSLWGCIIGGAIFGCALGWLWARKTSLDRRTSGK